MHVVVIRGARGYSHRHLVKGPGELCTLGILPIGYIASRAFVGASLMALGYSPSGTSRQSLS